MTRSHIRVLVTALGGDLGQALVKSLRVGETSFEIAGCDQDESGVGQAFVSSFHAVPPASDAAVYVDSVDALCRRHKIDAIVPASEAEISVLSQVGQRLPSGTSVVCQPGPWLRVFGDKLDCMQALKGHLHLAAFADSSDQKAVKELVRSVGFPLVVKARRSSGSRGIATVKSEDELAASIAQGPARVVQEFIDDQEGEFSVGVFRLRRLHRSSRVSARTGVGGMFMAGRNVTRQRGHRLRS
jgi:carbamoyl-phosphate synthase large subunit